LTLRNGPLRLLGVEDGSFDAFKRKTPGHTLLCCVLMKGDRILNVNHAEIEVDGLDATEKLLAMMRKIEVDAVILGGITFGGFNVIDPQAILAKTGVPVIVYSGVKPDNDAVLAALRKHFPDWKSRWKIIEGLGEIQCAQVFREDPAIYFEAIGCDTRWAEEILKDSAMISRIPEPVRVAGLVARGLTRVY
jgi:endonuclease V-like protein UPF0215 family